jgi:hypothetical protein
MALRLRRGTDAQRQLITPVEGELIYVTDTTELYVGDGTTVGGIRITGEVVNEISQLNDVDVALAQDGDILQYDNATDTWVAGELPLGDLSNVNVATVTDGQVLSWDSASNAWVPTNNLAAGGTSFDGDLIGSVFADDSTILVDGTSGKIVGDIQSARATFTGTVTTNDIVSDYGTIDDLTVVDGYFTTLNVTSVIGTGPFSCSSIETGEIKGDLQGSLFADDSTVLIDAVAEEIRMNTWKPFGGDIDISAPNRITVTYRSNETRNRLNFVSESDSVAMDTAYTGKYASINFGYRGVGEANPTYLGAINASGGSVRITHDLSGIRGTENYDKTFFIKDGSYGFNTNDPLATVHVKGDAIVDGTMTTDLIGSVYMDDSSHKIIDQQTGSVNAASFVQFGSLTSGERDALTPANGMVIYNTTNNKFEGVQNGVWINLDDGLAAS